ncbi:hypothetical protein ES708_11263 [subsurface metagenome]
MSRVTIKFPEMDIKLLNMILYFLGLDCGKTSKVGQMKFLFYSDFTYYRDYGRTISNAKYVKLPHGPCPDMWSTYLDELKHKHFIKLERKEFPQSDGSVGIGEYYSLFKGTYNDDLFDSIEIARMKEVYENLSKYKSSELSEMSHEEAPYIQAEDGGPLDLKYSYFIDFLSEIDEEEETPKEVRKAVIDLERAGVL